MRFEIDVNKVKPEIVVSHKGTSYAFSANSFSRKPFLRGFDVFAEINRYWEGMPSQQQDAVFAVYKDIYDGFDQILSKDDLYDHLHRCIKRLIELHPLNRLESWLSRDPSMQIPADIKPDFVEDIDSNNTRDKTYIAYDYVKLRTLSMFLRTIVPIWGEYINSIRRDTGMEMKEYTALRLLENTGILETEAVQKLVIYIDRITTAKNQDRAKILNSISTEDTPYLLLALVLIRTVCTEDLRGITTGERSDTHLVRKVFKFLLQRLHNASESDNSISIKPTDRNNNEMSASRRSVLESYRKRTEISMGDVAELEKACSQVEQIAESLAPGIDLRDVHLSIQSAMALSGERISDPQKAMLSWVMKRQISPRGILYPEPKLVIALLGVLEAVLWHRGFKYLACLATCHPIIGREEMIISPVDSRGQIPVELKDKILELYPYVFSYSRRKNEAGTPEPHPVLNDIDLVVDSLLSNAWRSTARESHIRTIFGDMQRKFPIRPDIKTDLARLIIDIESRI